MNSTELLNSLIAKKDLSASDTKSFFDAVVAGEIPPAQIAGILVALRIKGETAEEIEGLVHAMRSHMLKVEAPGAIDIVGTGGSTFDPFNISTAAMFVAGGAGAKVAKHGNRAASGKCGSADVLEALGVNVALTPETASRVYQKAGIVFLFAPAFHPATKNVVAVRKELKVRTVFNILGPFANPAGAKRQVVGVPNVEIAKKMAAVGKHLDYERLLIVTSDGMDEISISGKTHTLELVEGKTREFEIDPAAFGFSGEKEDLAGGDAAANAQIIRDILDGKKGPKRDVVVLNSAFALYVAGVAKDAKEGIKKAEKSIDSGAAKNALEALVRETQKYKAV